MENQMMILKNPAFGEVRIVQNDKGEPWFCGKDVADALGYARADNAIRIHVDDDDKLMHQISASGQRREMVFINESGLYALILSSKLPQAKEFKRWVTSEVLPAICKDGGYIATRSTDTPEQIMARAVLIAQETIKRLESENKVLPIRAEHLKKVLLCDQCYTTTQIAKEFGLTGRELYDKLMAMHILFQQSGQYMLYADYARMGLAKNRTAEKDMEDGTVKVFRPYLVWTERGRLFLHNMLSQQVSHVTPRTALILLQPTLFS